MGKEVFLRAYFIRMFILDNEINVVRDLIATYQEDPGKVDIFRSKPSYLTIGNYSSCKFPFVSTYERS